MRRRVIVLALVALAGCSARPTRPEEPTPGLAFPMHFAEGHGDGALAEPAPSVASTPSSAPGASGAAAPSGSVPLEPPRAFTSDPPDPEAQRLADQYEYTLHYEDEHIRLVALRHVRFPQPVVTARHVGRYAIELWIGHELVDRVRFDFPLLAASEAHQGTRHKLYEKKALTGGPYVVTVLVPAAPRARSARLVDRATRYQAALSWPPEPTAQLEITPMDPPSSVPAPAPSSSLPSASASSAAPTPPPSAPPATASALPAPMVPPLTGPAASTTASPKPSPLKPTVPVAPSRPTPPPPHELERR